MVPKIVIENPNMAEVSFNGFILGEFLTKLVYKAEEGLDNDKCSVEFVFENSEQARSFTFTVGRHFYFRYGYTHQLSGRRDLVVDKVEKNISKRGIAVNVELIPLVDYTNKSYPLGHNDAWERLAYFMKNGLELEVKLPYDTAKDIWLVKKIEDSEFKDFYERGTEEDVEEPSLADSFMANLANPDLDAQKRFSTKYDFPGAGQGVYDPGVESLLQKEFEEYGNPETIASDILQAVADHLANVEALELDARDNKVIIKDKDLEQASTWSFSYPESGIITYTVGESSKEVASESMVQATVDESTKDLGITKITTLEDKGFKKTDLIHVGDIPSTQTFWEGEDGVKKKFKPYLKFKVYTDGTDFYVADEEEGYASKLDEEGVEFIKQQINYGYDNNINWKAGRSKEDVDSFSYYSSVNPSDDPRAYAYSLGSPEMYSQIVENERLNLRNEILPFTNLPLNERVALTGPDFPVHKEVIKNGETVFLDDRALAIPDLVPEEKVGYWNDKYGFGLSHWRTLEYFNDNYKEPLNDYGTTYIRRKLESLVQTCLPYSQDELVSRFIKATTNEALNKRKVTITFEGFLNVSVGKIFYFNAIHKEDSGRYYLSEFSHTFTKMGFLTVVTGLRIPKELLGLRSKIKGKIGEVWDEYLDEAVSKLYHNDQAHPYAPTDRGRFHHIGTDDTPVDYYDIPHLEWNMKAATIETDKELKQVTYGTNRTP